jgi:hypothetical protein
VSPVVQQRLQHGAGRRRDVREILVHGRILVR